MFKWIESKSRPKAMPKHGDRRTVTKFLFFPKCINNEVRWLGKTSWVEQYTVGAYVSDFWYARHWSDQSDYV